MTTPPDGRPPLDVARLAAAEGSVEVVATATSTNAVVAERAREGAADGLVVVAEEQTAGRGRLDRTWEVPPRAALTFSVLLRPTAPPARWPWLPLLTGRAVATALRAAGVEAGLKWPNDVLVGDRKIAGILLERVETPQGPAAVVGIGLNVAQDAPELPVATATSVALELGRGADRTDLLLGLVAALRGGYADWQAGGDAGAERLRAAYAADCVTLGRDVRVELPGGDALTGRAVGVDAGGRLVVEHAGGSTAVAAGDVVHVRAQQ
ncbi:biotin--[acetyl-CoA-carboxylase] ligase [Nocardioides sp. SYSU D00038]|uniref:biotin--[acetyl-CoA-carboxylase] ligase n=1 Tax=Nocardioides sp. SYSU D00038 TaxID=2812554 RepID=UPI0027DC33CC|nr:biotin--[acetyl-CoA-carboxylase] ligase [Nocardioides sp. SYSU D00038]